MKKCIVESCALYSYLLCLSNVALQKFFVMKKMWVLYIVAFLLLLTGFYYLVFKNVDFSQSSLPVINDHVQSFSFINQNGKTITEKDVAGKVYVTEYFFTTCKAICPKMNANMRRVYDVYKDEKDFMILSHTCMPETDSVPVLKAYEQKMINGKLVQKWMLLIKLSMIVP